MNNNTDSGCSRSGTQTWHLAGAQALTSLWPQVTVQVTQIRWPPTARWPSVTNLALSYGADPKYLHSIQSQQELWTSTQNMISQPPTQPWPPAVAQAQKSLPLVARRPPHQATPLHINFSQWDMNHSASLFLLYPTIHLFTTKAPNSLCSLLPMQGRQTQVGM